MGSQQAPNSGLGNTREFDKELATFKIDENTGANVDSSEGENGNSAHELSPEEQKKTM